MLTWVGFDDPGAPSALPYRVHKSNRKSRKSRAWEKRQSGLKLEELRINRAIRMQKLRARQLLQSSPDWETLSTEDQMKRTKDALEKIDLQRKKKLLQAKERWEGSNF